MGSFFGVSGGINHCFEAEALGSVFLFCFAIGVLGLGI